MRTIVAFFAAIIMIAMGSFSWAQTSTYYVGDKNTSVYSQQIAVIDEQIANYKDEMAKELAKLEKEKDEKLSGLKSKIKVPAEMADSVSQAREAQRTSIETWFQTEKTKIEEKYSGLISSLEETKVELIKTMASSTTNYATGTTSAYKAGYMLNSQNGSGNSTTTATNNCNGSYRGYVVNNSLTREVRVEIVSNNGQIKKSYYLGKGQTVEEDLPPGRYYATTYYLNYKTNTHYFRVRPDQTQNYKGEEVFWYVYYNNR